MPPIFSLVPPRYASFKRLLRRQIRRLETPLFAAHEHISLLLYIATRYTIIVYASLTTTSLEVTPDTMPSLLDCRRQPPHVICYATFYEIFDTPFYAGATAAYAALRRSKSPLNYAATLPPLCHARYIFVFSCRVAAEPPYATPKATSVIFTR